MISLVRYVEADPAHRRCALRAPCVTRHRGRPRQHGYELRPDSDHDGWKTTFLHRSHVYYPWVGQVLGWWPTPWRAVQEAAWRALNTPLPENYSLSEE